MKFDFVVHKESLVTVFPEVMTELNLTRGQRISTEKFWEIISLNASTGLAKISIERVKNKEKS